MFSWLRVCLPLHSVPLQDKLIFHANDAVTTNPPTFSNCFLGFFSSRMFWWVAKSPLRLFGVLDQRTCNTNSLSFLTFCSQRKDVAFRPSSAIQLLLVSSFVLTRTLDNEAWLQVKRLVRQDTI